VRRQCRRLGRLRSSTRADERRKQQETAGVQDPTSFRREYSAMRIPKPASSVTTELPP
jgi:hypothetical protein